MTSRDGPAIPEFRDCAVMGHEWRLVGAYMWWCERCGAEWPDD